MNGFRFFRSKWWRLWPTVFASTIDCVENFTVTILHADDGMGSHYEIFFLFIIDPNAEETSRLGLDVNVAAVDGTAFHLAIARRIGRRRGQR